MEIVDWYLIGWFVLSSLLWCLLFTVGSRRISSVHKLSEQTLPPDLDTPKISIIIAACNEEETIEAALQTILIQDYPNFELVVVNDRSTDSTGNILDQMAQQDPRIVPFHNEHLPEGWLGKIHAMHKGTQMATGEWLLYMDADVHFKKGALRQAVHYVMHHNLDHITLIPKLICSGFWLETLIAAFGTTLMGALKIEALDDPNRKDAFAGVGAFNMVRRSTYEKSEGFEWFKMEIGDDMALGYVIKKAGGRTALLFGEGTFTLAWYPSLSAMFVGLEKNIFGIGLQYNISRLPIALYIGFSFLFGPLMALFVPVFPYSWAIGAVALLTFIISTVPTHRKTGVGWLPTLCVPAGLFLLHLVLIRSAWICWRQGGIYWRGTKYSLQELKKGQRLIPPFKE